MIRAFCTIKKEKMYNMHKSMRAILSDKLRACCTWVSMQVFNRGSEAARRTLLYIMRRESFQNPLA